MVSAINTNSVCPDGTPSSFTVGSCNVAGSPLINITGPTSGQGLFATPVQFPNVGVFSVVNPTYCQSGTPELACNAKAVITVSLQTQTPAPGSAIIVIGVNGSAVAFPTPLVVTTGSSVWFRFDTLAGVTQTDASGSPISGGQSCPIAATVGTFCQWTMSSPGSFFFRATPFNFGGRIDVAPNPSIPNGATVIDVGLNGNSFTVPSGEIMVNSMVYFRFNSYGPYRVIRADGPSCQTFAGAGTFDTLYQEAGRIVPVTITQIGVTYFYDPSFCGSDNMLGQIVAVGPTDAGDFVDVIVAPRNSVGQTELVFDPNPAIVYQGGSVRWNWVDFGHTVTQSANNDPNTCTAQAGGFDSGFIQPPVNGQGGQFTQRFDELGTFYYFCRAHCALGMRGAVIVIPRPQSIILHGVANDTQNPDRFEPPILTTFPNRTVCWDFQTAGDIVQSEFYGDCTPLAGGFNSGAHPVGDRVCYTFTNWSSCTAFYYYDSAKCQSNGMYGVVLLSDEPLVTVRASTDVFAPVSLNVTVGSTVTWTFLAAGNSVTQIPSLAQVTNPDVNVRCATVPGGINSGVIQNAPASFAHTFSATGVYSFITTPFCPFPSTVPGFYSSINVCNPIRSRETTPAPTSAPTPAPTQPCDPCLANQKKTVINFYFADILNGANVGCPTCGLKK